MSEKLTSLGLDVGTTSTQMVFSELEIENRAGSFAVPEMEIAGRKILYKSAVHFTPLLQGDLVDADALREIVDREYERAGITRKQVDTGAIIITGETSRKENARAVLDALSDYAGEFVVATAGPDLESALAARGAGAVAYSEKTGKRVLHMDIGGGTSNLALIEDGKIVSTTCLNVGGRLLKIGPDGRITYVSTVLEGLFHKKAGEKIAHEEAEELAEKLVQALEMSAGLREVTPLLSMLRTKGIATPVCALARNDNGLVISFSGGVADCIEKEQPWLAFGDIGPELGKAIRKSRLCQGEFMLGAETIRATVIGAGSHSAQLSGSTVFYQNMEFPLKNLPVVKLTEEEQNLTVQEAGKRIRYMLSKQDGTAALAMPGIKAPGYWALAELSEKILAGIGNGPLILALEEDMAKALGQILALRLGENVKILCIDRVRLDEGSYLDVGAPVGPALPVVVKTLILSR
ncbi:MAG: ethanolamine ammonia-lyase reactivating factor EutA [Oscillospiraceae bacterium]|nr:ethanolamine ammonia-lyase reactivating factor EutA [Oscillospiraceae bacterium]